MKELNGLIQNLKNRDEIDAVIIAGSKSLGEEKEYSDIDLAVIFKENREKLFSLFQFIDGKPADIFFYDIAVLQKLLADEVIPANTMDAVLISWLPKADVRFDKSGTLTSLKNKYSELERKIEVPQTEISKWESLINSGYVVNKRYYDSNSPEYHELLQIKLLQDLYNIFMGYFEFRNIPWRGEKQMLRYLKENDADFYNLYTSCIKASTIKEKFEIYSELVKKVFYGNYGMWNNNTVNPFIKGHLSNEEKSHLVEYWNRLIGRQE